MPTPQQLISDFDEVFKSTGNLELDMKFLNIQNDKVQSYREMFKDYILQKLTILEQEKDKEYQGKYNPTEIAERIVIEYANITGRDKTKRVFVREAAQTVLDQIRSNWKELTKNE